MMTINQSALATAVVNITGNTQGLERAIGETKRQMHGFLVFAQAIGGRTGGTLANMLAMGGGGPALTTLLGNRIGGAASSFLTRSGLMKNPIGDVDAAMKIAKSQYERSMFAHKMTGANIYNGGVYQGQRLNDARDVKVARIKHSMNAPKMQDFTENIVHGVTSESQNLAMVFGRIGAVAAVAIPVFKAIVASGMELDQKMRRASHVFGSTLNAAMSGYGGIGSNMSRSQYLAGASGIGQELTAGGIGSMRSSRMASSMTGRAGEIAASWGADFEDVAGKMQQALGGSNTAMKEFGVVLSDDLVRANAFNEGMIGLYEYMSKAVDEQSRYELIMRQSTDAAMSGADSFFSLQNQWNIAKSNFSSGMEKVGSVITPVIAGILGLANGLSWLMSKIDPFMGAFGVSGAAIGAVGNMFGGGGGGDAATPDPAAEKRALLARADDDAKRARIAIEREQGRLSSNVGFSRPEDFYNKIQKGIFGDPVEFQKRQLDLMHKFYLVSLEQLKALQDFGYKAENASGLIAP